MKNEVTVTNIGRDEMPTVRERERETYKLHFVVIQEELSETDVPVISLSQ